MPFVKGQPHMGHVLTPEDRAKAHAKAAQAMQQKKLMNLEDLKATTSGLLGRLTDWLAATDENGNPRFEQMLAESKIKDVAVVFGILTEKFLLTQGQPTTIMAHQEYKSMDEMALAIEREIKRRGLVKRPIDIEALAETVK